MGIVGREHLTATAWGHGAWNLTTLLHDGLPTSGDDGLKDRGKKATTMTEDLPEEEPIEVTVEEPEVEPEPVDPLTEALQRAEAAEEIATARPTCRTHERFAQDRAEITRYGAQHLARRMVSVLLDVGRGLASTEGRRSGRRRPPAASRPLDG